MASARPRCGRIRDAAPFALGCGDRLAEAPGHAGQHPARRRGAVRHRLVGFLAIQFVAVGSHRQEEHVHLPIGYTPAVAPTDAQIVLRLLLAGAIGGVLGAEREIRHKSAGFRTNILIALGSCIFTLVGMAFAAGDPSRVTAQIVTGIGFLGGGAILHSRDGVHGMTTAAMIWVNAALGAAAGAGHIRLATIGGAMTLAVLLILGPIERGIEDRGGPRS